MSDLTPPEIRLHPLNNTFSIPFGTLNIKEFEISQRGIVAVKKIESQEKFYHFVPKVCVIRSIGKEPERHAGNTCANCLYLGNIPLILSDPNRLKQNPKSQHGQTKGKMLKCKGCCRKVYCSASCQLVDWQVHKIECPMLATHREKSQGDPELARMVIRLVAEAVSSGKFKEQIKLLSNHMEEVGKLPHYREQILSVLKAVPALKKHPSELVKLILCVIFVNSMLMTDSFGYAIGEMLDPMVSLFNHSCRPNAELIFNNRDAFLVSNINIEPGEEIFLNYTLRDIPTFLRRFDLKRRYFFDCNCIKCSLEFDEHQSISCNECQTVIWNFSFQDYLIGILRSPCTDLKNKCCQKNYKIIEQVQLELFEDYKKLIGLEDKTFEQHNSLLQYVFEKCQKLPTIDSIYFEKYQQLIDESLCYPVLIPPKVFPLSHIAAGMEIYLSNQKPLNKGPLQRLLIHYFNNFIDINDPPCVFTAKLDALNTLLLSLKTASTFFSETLQNKLILSRMIISLSISVVNDRSKIYSQETGIFRRSAIIFHNECCAMKAEVNGSEEFAQLAAEWNQGVLTIDKLNSSVDDFGRLLREHDPRFLNWDSSLFYVDGDTDVANVLKVVRQYISFCILKQQN